MKKIARMLMIIAVAVAGLSVIAFMIAMLFQGYFVEGWLGKTNGRYFMIPVGDMISCLGTFALTLVMLFRVCDHRYSIKLDAICAGLIALGVPLVSDTVDYSQTRLTIQLRDMKASLYYSGLLTVSNLALSILYVAIALTLIACGMSIAVKYASGTCKNTEDVV